MGAGWELLATDPDIEGIPDRQAARFVDRRRFTEFAVFWPTGSAVLNPDATSWRQPLLTGGSVQARWARAALNCKSGRVELGDGGAPVPSGPWVPGFVYAIQDRSQADRISALPATCPCCASDYARRLYKKSPIRGFRTGFSKLTQLLSKELFYAMPAGDARKLVVFSDSREEAAGLANGIERSHYLDLVREAMYDELSNLAVAEPLALRDIEAGDGLQSAVSRRFADTYPQRIADLTRLVRAASTAIPDLEDAEMKSLLEARRDRAVADLVEIRNRIDRRTVPLRALFETPGATDSTGPGLLIQRFKALGVNPRGNDVLYQDYKYDDGWHRWTQLFDFSDARQGWNPTLSPEAREKREHLRSKVVAEVSGVLFSRLYSGSSQPASATRAWISVRPGCGSWEPISVSQAKSSLTSVMRSCAFWAICIDIRRNKPTTRFSIGLIGLPLSQPPELPQTLRLGSWYWRSRPTEQRVVGRVP